MAPSISGNTLVGSVITTTTGTWTNTPTSFAYLWYSGTTPIPSQTNNSYTTVSGDIGATITCQVVATNAGGSSAPVTSSNSIVVVPPAPANYGAPSISLVGSVITTTTGTWTNTPTSFAYLWYSGTTPIPSQTNNSYTIVSGDVGSTITCQVVATNAGGSSAPATSNAIVVPPIPFTATWEYTISNSGDTYDLTDNLTIPSSIVDPFQNPLYTIKLKAVSPDTASYLQTGNATATNPNDEAQLTLTGKDSFTGVIASPSIFIQRTTFYSAYGGMIQVTNGGFNTEINQFNVGDHLIGGFFYITIYADHIPTSPPVFSIWTKPLGDSATLLYRTNLTTIPPVGQTTYNFDIDFTYTQGQEYKNYTSIDFQDSNMAFGIGGVMSNYIYLNFNGALLIGN